MATGYILIAAILILGGVIATVGDRIGTRVGKARLSLFNLRPKKTAVIVTIFTGGLISASSLAILFATPYIKISGRPIMLFNILERKFILLIISLLKSSMLTVIQPSDPLLPVPASL